MSGTCIDIKTRASVRHVWDMHRPRDIQASYSKWFNGIFMVYIKIRELITMCAAKVARGSPLYVKKASHTIPEAKRVACHSSLVILYNAMDGG
ncbi:Aldehyde oxidase [Gossypium arboreum]|uniref:Aldehyde oxidase n=1 Tax=Gossypium arboreum TaxID=29729 RepID=A0A0B0MUQ9_GOSAR|nr:Aldehyde oxidase [Gossypium arboreum]